ncbi:putative N-acetylmannosamine-6-phosphate 2-epimerase [Rhodobacteraceae bacterium RKSG542]|uniref:N-acetylmannosamine-6-phosphate 2-epimerase n=1 Tax=Pseudovibrio flavus TaxID=2529854 RepID=UPI0012BCD907|nr:putative N-acetylmannosamine-6-phosphate 2-epimerase [Pseudovibrio flavus]MTI16461.1 putative N-acetylmannosamine-6-phosphate 2-epimerase [Pseudovibrio flavus]
MDILSQLKGGLVVSCQPVDNGPLDKPEIVAALAQAAVAGGAAGLRIEGVENLKAVRPTVSVPIIGIVKSDLEDTPVRITVLADHAKALAEAGADIIAYDGTSRERPDSREAVIAEIRKAGKLIMADCSSMDDAYFALEHKVEIIGTTLSGYTEETKDKGPEPDFALLRQFSELGAFVMAEGRFNTPALAAEAMSNGADSVTVGSALTRLEVMVEWFEKGVSEAYQRRGD